ncbi:MAG: hypothetical protein ABI672_02035 [Vicinamibacteria bacterium]
MLKFLKGLFTGSSVEESVPGEQAADDRVRFAGLVLSEVTLYDGKLLQGLSLDPGLQNKLKTTLQRSYQMYLDRTVGAPERETVFRDAAVRILANGNKTLLEPALSEVLREAGDRAADPTRDE